jgi:hypothetical protein
VRLKVAEEGEDAVEVAVVVRVVDEEIDEDEVELVD